MRLMDTTTFKLEEFFGSQIPYYAILSHRWEDEEVTFQNLQMESRIRMKGWRKILCACAQAVSDGWEYIWIDSCCIDKTSSAELSEAINSMFRWYQAAQVCYAYLSDVPKSQRWLDHWITGSPFRKSKWFTRGWTLQELLAPETVIFFDDGWLEIGTKSSMETLITSITGIDELHTFRQASIAQKMSWVSKRVTLREEDMAYCLLGIFGVQMALLYGEGHNSFIRLQLEILKNSDDESIFAWTEANNDGYFRGLLAGSPTWFKDSGNIVQTRHHTRLAPYSMTNKGLQMTVILYKLWRPVNVNPCFATRLCCIRKGSSVPVELRLERCPDGSYRRVDTHKLFFSGSNLSKDENTPTIIYVRQYETQGFRNQVNLIAIDLTQPQFHGYDAVTTLFEQPHDCSLHCKCLVRCQYTVMKYTLGRRPFLVVFSRGRSSFVLGVSRGYHDTISIGLTVPDESQTLDHILSSFNSNYNIVCATQSDTVSARLSSGDTVSASRRRRLVDGELYLAITINFPETLKPTVS